MSDAAARRREEERAAALAEEGRRLRRLRMVVDLTTNVIMQGRLSRREAEELVAAARSGILDLFPDKESTYELILAPRFARLLEAWAETAGVRLEGYGSWTLKDEERDCGAEPDECYCVNRLARSDEDRPDLAIEVVWTSGGINKLEVYRRLGVREVWFYERGSLRFFTLRGDRGRESYVEIPLSEILPQLPRELLLECMREPDQTAAVLALRATLPR